MPVRLGRGNPLLRRLRALRREPAQRAERQVFVAEGPHLVEAALDSGASIELALMDSRLTTGQRGRELVDRLEDEGAPLYEVAESVMRTLQDARQPQAVLLVVHHAGPAEWPPLGEAALVVVACGIQDPGNLGSLMRTSEAAGAAAFVCSGSGVDLHHPRVLRATAGSIFRLPAIVSAPEALCRSLRCRGLRLVGTTPTSGEAYDRADLTGATAILFGSEGSGLSESVRAELDQSVHVPMRSAVESLSVGAAAAVVLFESARQRTAQSEDSSSSG